MKRLNIVFLLSLLIFTAACSSSRSAAPDSGEKFANDAYTGGGAMNAPQAAYREEYSMIAPDAIMPVEAQEADNEYVSAAIGGDLRPEKILKSGTVQLATENFDSDKTRLEALTREMDGFIERANISNRNGSRYYEVTIRVPSERFAEMKKAVEETGRLISSDEYSENVTSQYYDMEGRLNVKRIEEERILEMIEEAENVETLLALEEYLGKVRTDIELLVSRMNDIDSLSAYSTLNVYMTEGVNVKLMADAGNFGQRLWQNLRSSAGGTAAFFGDVLVFLAGAVIPLSLLALLVFTCILAGKKLNIWNRRERTN